MAIKILGDIVSVVSEHISNPNKSGYQIFVGLEHYDSGEPVITRHGSTEQLESSVKHFIEGDILVARRNVYLKRAGVVNFEGVTSGDSIVLRVKEEKYKDIIPFILNTDDFWDYAEQNSDGTMSKRLAPDVLLEYECNIPENHQSIADKLWAAYKLKVSYRQMITATDEMVKSQFIEMFGDPVKNDKNLGQKNLSALGKLERGVSKFRPRNAPELLDGPYPLVQTGDVANCDIYITNYNSTYSEIGLRQSKLWPSGTLCITIAANIAKTGILTFDACFPDSIVGFIPDKDVDILYIHFWFNMIQQHIENLAPSTAQKNINLSVLSNLQVICPPISDQKKFSNILEQADKSKFTSLKSQFIEMFGDTPERVELSSLCDTFIDGDWIEAKDQAEDGIRLIQTGNVGVGVFKDKGDKARYISEDTFERLNCTEVKNGDILVSRLPDPVGRACIIPGGLGKTITAVDCTIIRLADKIVPKFFIAFTNTPDYAMQIKKVLSGTTRLRVSRANLGKIHVPLPAIQKQIEFVSIAEQADKSKYIN